MTEPPDPANPPAPEQPPAPTTPPRTGRGMIVAAIALAAVLVIAGATLAGWLLMRDTDRDGPAEPAIAVDAFLRAVYQEHDPTGASALVCAQARDEAAMTAKIDSIQEYADTYAEPRFTWGEPELVEETEQLAVMAVKISIHTADERSADQTLHVSVLDKEVHGWWVCDIETIAEEPDGSPDEGEEGGDEPDEDE